MVRTQSLASAFGGHRQDESYKPNKKTGTSRGSVKCFILLVVQDESRESVEIGDEMSTDLGL